MAISSVEQAIQFLMECLEYTPDEDLTEINSEKDAASQVDGYIESFGDELPKKLMDPGWMMYCWNKAVKREKHRRIGNLLGDPELSYEISECGLSLEEIIDYVESTHYGFKFSRTEKRYTSCIMAIFTKE